MVSTFIASRVMMGSCALAAVVSNLALAQTTPVPGKAIAGPGKAIAGKASGDINVDEIVVTARKREESAQAVPVSLTVQSGEALVRQNAVTVADISNATPNVRLLLGGIGGTSIVSMIRGQVQLESQSTSDPSVGIYIDGTYLARSNGSVSELHDIQRVEVLKGPQGTLYGRNTPGGAVNIISKAPELDTLRAIFSARGASQGEMAGRITLNIPIVSDKAAIRLTGAYTHVDGWARDNQSGRNVAGKDNLFWRASVLLKLTDRLSILSITDYNDIDVTGAWFKLVNYSPIPGRNLAGEAVAAETLTAILAVAPISQAAAAAAGLASLASNVALPFNRTNLTLTSVGQDNFNSHDKTRVWGNTTTISYKLSDALLLKSLTGYRNLRVRNRNDVDGTQYSFIDNKTTLSQHQFSEELQLQGESAGGKLNWIIGGYYFRERASDENASVQARDLTVAAALQGFIPGITPPANPAFIPAFIQGLQATINSNPRRVIGQVVNKSYAGFAQGTFQFSDQLSATAGIRYTRDVRSLDSTRRSEISGRCGLTADVSNVDLAKCVASFKDSFGAVTWTVGMEYKPTADILAYVKGSRGFRSGGRNLRGSTAKTLSAFKPETVTDIEAGIKSEFFERRLRLNFSAFRSDYRDLQRPTLVFEATPQGFQVNSYIQNIQKATITGFEFEAAARPTDFLQVGGTAGYTRAKYDKFLTAEGVDRSAEPFQYVPEWTVSAFAQATLPLSGTVDLVPRIDYRHTAKIFYGTSSANIAAETEPAFDIFNARLSLNIDSIGFEAALFSRNLFNKHYFADQISLISSAGLISGRVGEPRTIGVELRKTF